MATILKFPTFDGDDEANVVQLSSIPARQRRDAREYERRCAEHDSVRPIPAEHLRAIFNPKPDTFAMLAERHAREAVEADERRDRRVRAWQRRVTVLCIVLFYVLLVFFSFQIGRGL